ncbi:MAG: hypothetical protein ACOH2F_12400 [Cellulomonas sp.]
MRGNTGLWFVAAAAGVLSGWLGARPLVFLSWGNALIWLVVTVLLGLRPGSKRSKALRLGTYGFATGFSFMCFGYAGEVPLVERALPFALIGLFCAAGAVGVGFVTHLLVARRTP